MGAYVIGWIRRFLRLSPRVHLREHNVKTLTDVVDLLDRFLNDQLRYPLELDDFVSWKNNNASVEQFRERVAATEPLLLNSVEI